MAYIYRILNNVNGKMYIGETMNNPTDRKVQHFSNLRCHRHANIILQRAYDKYGEDKFTFEVLFECPDEVRFEKEVETIALYDSFNNGYNLTPGGDGPGGHHMSGEKNPMYGRSGADSPVFKGYIYQLDPNGNIINKYGSSCLAAADLLGHKIERGTKNSQGVPGHILECCNGWSIITKAKRNNRFSANGYQWIREKDYNLLKSVNYDFKLSSRRIHNCPLTDFNLDNAEGALNSNI